MFMNRSRRDGAVPGDLGDEDESLVVHKRFVYALYWRIASDHPNSEEIKEATSTCA